MVHRAVQRVLWHVERVVRSIGVASQNLGSHQPDDKERDTAAKQLQRQSDCRSIEESSRVDKRILGPEQQKKPLQQARAATAPNLLQRQPGDQGRPEGLAARPL